MRQASFLFVLLLFFTFLIHAQEYTPPKQGTLEAFGKKGQSIDAFALKHTDVKADISGFLVRVHVRQEFENNFSTPIEAIYTFPLPNNSAVDDMTMQIGKRTISGKIMPRAAARKVYETAKSKGQITSLLDQQRPNIFTQSVANILPNEQVIIDITYVETLKYEDGAYQFVFPMTVAPRYIPKSIKPEDAQKITPTVVKERSGHDISIEVNLNAGVPIEEIRSKWHEIETISQKANTASVKLKDQNSIPNKDFILDYDVRGKKIEDALLTHRDSKGGFFTLILQPPAKPATEDITPKEIVFVLDTSGSMSGFPIEKAKEAMKMSLEGLYPNDTFNLITFAGNTSILFDKPVPATRANLNKAQEFLDTQKGYGGTEMMKAIRAALDPSDAQDHLRIVCFMTDGEVGNDLEIVGEVQKHPNARVFSFGIGSSVNRLLLDKIADEGRGEATYVTLKDDGSAAAKKFYERVRTPLLTDISVDWNGLPVADIYPKKMSDLFGAKPVVIYGRYTKGGNGTIRLRGKTGGKDFVREIVVKFPEKELSHDVLATLWARTRIDDLMSKDWKGLQNNTAQPEIEQTITQIGIEYRLMTQFTSFVAVEKKIVNKGGKQTQIEVPVELPEGMSEDMVSDTPFARLQLITSLQRPPQAVSGKGSGGGQGMGNGRGTGSGTGSANGALFSVDGFSGGNAPPKKRTVSAAVANFPAGVEDLTLTINPKDVADNKAVFLPSPLYPQEGVGIKGTVQVQVKIDEDGNVIFAQAVNGHPLLKAVSEQAAQKAKFEPYLVEGQKVKIFGMIVYNFIEATKTVGVSLGERRFIAPTPTPEMQAEIAKREKEAARQEKLAEKLHFWIYALVERLEKNISTQTDNETKFVADNKAEVQIWLAAKTPEVLAKLKSLGFEMLGDKQENIIVGRIPIDKISDSAEIKEIQYVLPNIK